MGMYPLQDGEEVLWSGWPQRQRRWFYEHTVLIVISVLVVTQIVLSTALGGSPLSAWYLAFLVLAAVYLERLKIRRAWARAISYQVTSQRIIFTARWPGGTESRWVWLAPLSPPQVRVGADGVGTVTFGIGLWTRWQLRNDEMRGAWAPFVPELRNIQDAQQVAELITRLQGAQPPQMS